MDDATLLHRVKEQLYRSAGFEDEIAEDRRLAIRDYYQRANGTEVVGRAQTVSGDVSATVEATLAAMTEAFSGDAIAAFDSLGPDDEEQAQLESAAVQHFVMGQACGRLALTEAIKDALLLRNGWTKCWLDERTETVTEYYSNVTPEALAELTTRPGLTCKIKSFTAGGDAELRCTVETQEFRFESVPIENVFHVKHYDGLSFDAIQRIPFIAERHVEPRSELYARFSRAKVDELQAVSVETNTTALARNPRRDAGQFKGIDKDAEHVEWYECYVMLDGERRVVCWGGNTLLTNEPAARVPYACGVAIIAPHRLTGISLWDKVRQTQDTNTQLGRALLDNVAATSKQRLAYIDGKVNVDDVGDGRVNGALRIKSTVNRASDAVMPFAVPDTSGGIQSAISHQRQIRTEMAGSSLDMQSAEVQLGKQVGSMGLDRAYSVAEALAAHMTRNIADTLVRSTFLLAHAVLREMAGAVPLRAAGQWVTTTPGAWPERQRVSVKVGLSAGERTRRAAALDRLLQAQIQLAGLGMDEVLVNVGGFHAALLDWCRVSEIPSPERYVLDPRAPESQQAMRGKQKAAAEAEAAQKELMRQAVELEKLKTALEKYVHDSEMQFKYWDSQLSSEVEEAKIAGKATTDLLAARRAPKQEDKADAA